jgi:hypothetical protein
LTLPFGLQEILLGDLVVVKSQVAFMQTVARSAELVTSGIGLATG